MNLFTSDLHIGHKVITKYRNNFKSPEEHDEYWIQKIESLGKRDILHVLGDFIFENPRYDEYIKRLRNVKCRIKVIMGNHDSLKLYDEVQLNKEQNSKIEIQLPFYSYKNFWVSHCPIHPSEIRNRHGVIHGHLHKKFLYDDRYFDVCPEKHNYEFVEFDKIKDYFKVN